MNNSKPKNLRVQYFNNHCVRFYQINLFEWVWMELVQKRNGVFTCNLHAVYLEGYREGYALNGPLARYVKLQVSHAPGMSGTISPPPRVSVPDVYHDTCVAHVLWSMPVIAIAVSFEVYGEGKVSRHSRCMHNPQFYVSVKRPMAFVSIVSSSCASRSTHWMCKI